MIFVYTLLAKVFGGGLTKKRRYDTEKNKENGKNSHCGGVMHYSAQLTDNGIGVGSQYPMSWEVGDFSADGYATASIMSPNGMMKFTGIINRQGIFVVVYQIEGGEE